MSKPNSIYPVDDDKLLSYVKTSPQTFIEDSGEAEIENELFLTTEPLDSDEKPLQVANTQLLPNQVSKNGLPDESFPNTDSTTTIKKKSIFTLYEKMMQFDIDEVNAFKDFSRYLSPNPRKIKRITNEFRCVRLLAELDTDKMVDSNEIKLIDKEFRRRLLAWIILIEQWPVRMAWIIQILEDDEQIQTDNSKAQVRNKTSLYDFFKNYVEDRVFNLKLSNNHPENLVQRYMKLFALDFDPELFDLFLKISEINLDHIGSFYERTKTSLNSYTTNLNPALRNILSQIVGLREDINDMPNRMMKTFKLRSVEIYTMLKQPKPCEFNVDKLVEWVNESFNGDSLDDEESFECFCKNIKKKNINGSIMQNIMSAIENNIQPLTVKPLEDLGIKSSIQLMKFITKWRNDSTVESLLSNRDKELNRNLIDTIPDTTIKTTVVKSGQNSIPVTTAKIANKREINSERDNNNNNNNIVIHDQKNESINAKESVDDSKLSHAAQGRTTDDKTGKDHVGYMNYALVLAMLIHLGVSVPVVFGLYASWGTGKSFIMNKVIAALQMLWLRDELKNTLELELMEINDSYKHDSSQVNVIMRALEDIKNIKEIYIDSKNFNFEGNSTNENLEIRKNELIAKVEEELFNLMTDDEETINALFNWVLLGCPEKLIGKNTKINEKWNNRNETASWLDLLTDFLLVNTLLKWITKGFKSFIYNFSSIIEKGKDNQLCHNNWGYFFSSAKTRIQNESQFLTNLDNRFIKDKACIDKQLSKLPSQLKSEAIKKFNHNRLYQTFKDVHAYGNSSRNIKKLRDNEKDTCTYEFVWWNAWLYSGSDNLWAGLIKEPHDVVEKHYGSDFSNAQQKAKFYAMSIQIIAALLFLALSVFFGYELSQYDSSAQVALATFASIVGSVGLTAGAILTQLNFPEKDSDKIVKDLSSADFRKKLGFMADIKDKLVDLGNKLKDPVNLPNVWHYLIPECLGKSFIIKSLTYIFGGEVKLDNYKWKPCKVVIFVDDLDRCQPEKSVEVLQSLVLLTENTPFVVFLAIDPRIVVTAIESVSDKFFSEAGVSGYEYLDKIVQIPFAIPVLVNEEKKNLCTGYLTNNEKLRGTYEICNTFLNTLINMELPLYYNDTVY